MSAPEFPPLHAAVIAYLGTATGIRTSGRTPGELKTAAHVIYCLGGHEDDPTLSEVQTFDVQTFAPTYDEASRLARGARAALRFMAGRSVPLAGQSVQVDWTRCDVVPHPEDYENPNVVRMVSTYRVAARVQ